MTVPGLARLLDPAPLSARDVTTTFDALTSATSDDTDRAALLLALRARGDRADELVRFAREMRRRAVRFPVPGRDHAVDLCGSGGARRPSFNVSTASAFVVRAAGQRVVKHGNRSRRVCGSSDVLAALGLPVLTSIGFARASYRRFGIAFLHAPLFHPATRAVAAVRRRLGVPTVFNRLGPLTNPAGVGCQVTGVVDVPTAIATASVLPQLGVRRGIAMTSDEGCDEFSPHGLTTAIVWRPGSRRKLRVDPADYLDGEDRRGPWAEMAPTAAAEEVERIFAGGGGARRGSVLLTSGAALWVAGRAPSLAAGVRRAQLALDSGAADRLLADVRRLAGAYPRSQEG
jgi:anthranilate phosphoribosyltransferase